MTKDTGVDAMVLNPDSIDDQLYDLEYVFKFICTSILVINEMG